MQSCSGTEKSSWAQSPNHLPPPGVFAGVWLALLPVVVVAVAVAVAVAVVTPWEGGLATPTELRMAEAEPPSGAGAGVGVLPFPLPAVQAQAPKTARPARRKAAGCQRASINTVEGNAVQLHTQLPSAPSHSPSLGETNADRPPLPAHMHGRYCCHSLALRAASMSQQVPATASTVADSRVEESRRAAGTHRGQRSCQEPPQHPWLTFGSR